MDLLLYWLPIFGALFLGSFFFYALSIRNHKAAAWYGIGGVVCFVLVFVLQLAQEMFAPAPVDARQVDGPVLSIDRYGAENALDANGQVVGLAFRPIAKNSGRTVATNVRVAINLIAEPNGLPEDFDYPDIDHGHPPAGPFVVAPGQSLRSPGFQISIPYAERMRTGKIQVFLYGWIEYDDTFEGTRRHRTEYCMKVEVVIVDPRTTRRSLYFNPYGPHNCIDKNCLYAPGRQAPKAPMEMPPHLVVIQ